MDTIMIIYKTTNLVNGKIYIGKDKRNNPKYLGSGKLLNKAIKKYGRENFIKEILEYCNSEEHMSEREKIWTCKFNSTDRAIGYNMTEGGAGGNTRINYTKQQFDEYKLKLSMGVQNSKKYINSIKNKTGKIIPHNLGKVTSAETRRKISVANAGKKLSDEHRNKIASSKSKPIDQFDMNGIFIKTYHSIKHASNENNIGRDSIYGCCIGKYKQGGGYKWQYSTITKE